MALRLSLYQRPDKDSDTHTEYTWQLVTLRVVDRVRQDPRTINHEPQAPSHESQSVDVEWSGREAFCSLAGAEFDFRRLSLWCVYALFFSLFLSFCVVLEVVFRCHRLDIGFFPFRYAGVVFRYFTVHLSSKPILSFRAKRHIAQLITFTHQKFHLRVPLSQHQNTSTPYTLPPSLFTPRQLTTTCH